jgi:hypothetical protein
VRERLPCEFFLVRYVPDVVKGEFVNIGVLLREATADPDVRPAVQVRFTRDWSRVRCMDAGADVGLLEDLEQEIALRLRSGINLHEPKGVLDVLQDSLSNSVQMTGGRAALAENMTTEMEQLMRMYVEPMQTPRVQAKAGKTSGRTGIQASMRTEFERAGVWAMMNKRLAAERYTRKGDPLRIDCGYRKDAKSGGAIRMFQAVSLEGDVEMAKVLAYTAPQMSAGVAQVEGASLELTAVVEPLRMISEGDDEAQERYRFGVETMEQREIRVVTLNDLARVAVTARHELGL